jgi:type VI secretion system VasD/TssJ family lipoprotein
MFSSKSDAPVSKYSSGQPQVSAAAPPPQEFKKGAISLNITADPQLNRYKNSPHTLLVCLYQLKDPNAFNQLADDPNSLAKLMECTKFDSSISYAKRIVIQPGQTLTEQRDRAEGTRFIGIAAGYFTSGNEKTTHLTPITARATTSVSIEFGPNEISSVTVK